MSCVRTNGDDDDVWAALYPRGSTAYSAGDALVAPTNTHPVTGQHVICSGSGGAMRGGGARADATVVRWDCGSYVALTDGT